MFGTLSITEDTEINYKNNFRNFPNAMMLLFRASTGEGKGLLFFLNHFLATSMLVTAVGDEMCW